MDRITKKSNRRRKSYSDNYHMGKELSNMDVALFALYRQGGVSRKVHTEEIAYEAYQLAKERFSWRLKKFRDMGFPDKSPVRFALEQAKKESYGGLVSGKAGGGKGGKDTERWGLTPQGVIWIKENEARITESLKQKTPMLHKDEAIRFMRKIKTDSFFKFFQENKTLDGASKYMFADMLVCAPDASKEIMKQKFDQMYAMAELTNDEKILEFLKACKKKFIHLIS